MTGTMDSKAVSEKLRCPMDVVALDNENDGKDAATKALTTEMEAWTATFYNQDQQSLINIEFMLSDENPNS